MAQRQPAPRQQRLSLRPAYAGPERRGQRTLVEREERVDPAQVEADHRAEGASQRLDAADDARAAAEGHHRDPGLGGGVKDRANLRRGPGRDDGIRSPVAHARALADEVRIALARGVHGARAAVVADVLLPHRGGQARPRFPGQRGLVHANVLERHGPARLLRDPDLPAQERRGVVGETRDVVGIAPSPPLHLAPGAVVVRGAIKGHRTAPARRGPRRVRGPRRGGRGTRRIG